MKDDIAIIIPAYNPTNELYKLVTDLKSNQYKNIIVINDGSQKVEQFEQIKTMANIVKHKKNEGKGIAIKTGIKYCLENFSNILGIITVDADGQHIIEDINKIYQKLKEHPNNVIFGSRDLEARNVPKRSKIGNKIFRYILKRKDKIEIKDTQTGLRAIPQKYLKEVGKIKGKRYEYEANVIKYCAKNSISIYETSINTIYINKNKESNYKIIQDTIRIYLSSYM